MWILSGKTKQKQSDQLTALRLTSYQNLSKCEIGAELINRVVSYLFDFVSVLCPALAKAILT